MRVGVVGAGVVGLSAAYELASGHEVTVIHDADLLASTSAVATAIWHVYLVDPDDQQNLEWSEITLKRLIALHDSSPGAGVELVTGVELFRNSEPHVPSWAHIPPLFEMLGSEELEQSFPGISWGYRISAPTVEMHRYLGWLHGDCVDRGVTFRQRRVDHLDALLDEFDYVVNCAGLAAGALVDDPELYPVRGQYLVLESAGPLPATYVGDDEHPDGMAYMIPRAGQILVGGTEEPGKDDLSWSIDDVALLARAGVYCRSDLDGTSVLARVVGLRPCRTSRRVRFEPDPAEPRIFHNYGHGGSGFSLAWGCAADLARSLEALPQPRKAQP